MTRTRQLSFQESNFKIKKTHGGSLVKSHPKTRRPISTKHPMHIVMRSKLAKGNYSLLNSGKSKQVNNIVRKQAKRFHIRIYEYANAGNHIHILLKTPSRKALNSFLRAASGLIARFVMGIEKGQKLLAQFWEGRPFSRVVTWGRDYLGVKKYLLQNTLEALGFISYTPRKYQKVVRAP